MKDIILNQGGVGTVKKLITSLLAPLQTMTNGMKDFETLQVKRSTWNGRKMVLQAALNDIFGITTAPFIIVETNQDVGDNLFFYEPSESIPVYFSEPSELEPVYFFEPGELPATDYDFKVLIPSGIWTAEIERQIKAQTGLYKLAGPKVIFETY